MLHANIFSKGKLIENPQKLNIHLPSGNFGAILMKTPEKVAEICRAMNDSMGGLGRVSVKCRVGIDNEESFSFLSNFVSKA
ncbi:tRNA-dihydrouridine synthase A [Smittium mucronatum]|uniref:tRNA-dihydrouridine synthase A n=1 Tax=Smittium mucronatum TaxID=133383 RepID=A0A1R0H868_9FUNG|nr:tRNA-dihydrouridine synthase A [Smittium mucronatum]